MLALRRCVLCAVVVLLWRAPSAADPARFSGAELTRRLERARRLEVEQLRLTAKADPDRPAAHPKHKRRRSGSTAARPAPGSDLPPPRRIAPFASSRRVTSIPVNTKLNDSSGDASIATQSEESVAASGLDVVAAWNDGEGSSTGGAYQGFAWSSDGGQTWIDGGDPPKPPSLPQFRWTSDPAVTVDEKTGTFYFTALANSDATHNAIAVARGSFNGANFSWQDVKVVLQASNNNGLLDKEWIVADSSGAGGAVYLAYTLFTHSGDEIDFQRSTDGGATWSTATKLSSNADNGQVHAARPVVGPGGELYVVWNAIGQSTAEDFLRLRKSVNRGQTFGSEVTVTGYIANFGTGAPGYNRERGIHFPSIAVDRTSGNHRGRVYVSWTEAFNFQDDPLGTGASRVEVEPNGFAAAATPFTPGDVLRGTIASAGPADFDDWSFSLAAGQSLVAWADSLSANMTYAMRVFGAGIDTTQSLCFGGDFTPGSEVQQAFYTFTAPIAGTYTLRMGPIDGSSPVGPYRVVTGFGVRGTERGRDQRDVFVSWSDGGATWNTPIRVNDDPPGFDDYLAEVGVGSDGFPYAEWFDFRDEAYGATANQYGSRSADGGATWQANQRLSDVSTNWPNTGSNLAPNMGDYSAMAGSGPWLHALWADGRDGSADVYGTRLGMGVLIASCSGDASVAPGSSVPLGWTLVNANPAFANDYSGSIATSRSWPLPAAANLTIPAGGSAPMGLTLAVPDTAAPGPVTVTFTVVNASGAIRNACPTTLMVTGSVGVGQGPRAFDLAPPVPNPASRQVDLSFDLAQRSRVQLRLFAVGGQAVRTLIDAELDPGPHHATWEGRDQRGKPVAPGVYFVRLDGAAGTRIRRLVWRP